MHDLKLLIVDDDDVDRERLRRLIGRAPLKADVTEASTAEEAMEYVKNGAYDCVLLDYHLGNAIGTDLVPLILSEAKVPCPVIMVTGAGDETVAVEAMRIGVYDYLPKSKLEPARLGASIEASVNRAELENKLSEMQQRAEWLSLHDSLTGLPNRNLFFDRLEQAMHSVHRAHAKFALLMLDLDLFKEVNDTFGHQAGDKLLAEVGRRLRTLSRESDTFARLGGDEFAGILLGTDTEEGAAIVARRITTAMQEPILIDDTPVTVGISIGVALAPDHAQDGRTLLAYADAAMYRAKRGSRGHEVHNREHESHEPSPVLLSSSLHDALDRNEIFLHFQPKVDLRTREIVGAEALARWNSPRFGLLPPAEFLPAAERSGIIAQLTDATFVRALDQAKIWRTQGRPLPVAVNLSPRMLDDESLVARIAEMLRSRDLPPQLLTVEITETALMAYPERARATLSKLRSAGIAISIDDFGTGFTSMKHLRDFDISEIKIDPVFVSELAVGSKDASIISSLVALASGFGVDLIAEGVERPELWQMLCSLGCHLGQGYSIAKPMPPAEFDDWRTNWADKSAAAR